MTRSILKFLNSPLGILLLTSCIVGPAGFFISEYRNSVAERQRLQREAQQRIDEEAAERERQEKAAAAAEAYRTEVLAHCTELSERNIDIRGRRDYLRNRGTSVPAVAELFLSMPTVPTGETGTEGEVHYADSRFRLISFSLLVNRLEDLTARDDEFRLMAQRITREHDASYSSLRTNDEPEARRQLALQNQELLDCKVRAAAN
jgi:hypothetical protein